MVNTRISFGKTKNPIERKVPNVSQKNESTFDYCLNQGAYGRSVPFLSCFPNNNTVILYYELNPNCQEIISLNPVLFDQSLQGELLHSQLV